MSASEPSLHSIWVTPKALAEPRRIERAEAVAGRGLTGDRYADGRGSFSGHAPGRVRELSLIAFEDVRAFVDEVGRAVEPGALRRNLVTLGLDLRELSGALLAIGAVRIEITGSCPPCGLLDRQLGFDARGALRRRGGVRARIVTGGELVAGAAVVVERQGQRLP